MSREDPDEFDEVIYRRRKARETKQLVMLGIGCAAMAGFLAFAGIVVAVVLYRTSEDKAIPRQQPPAVVQSKPAPPVVPAAPKTVGPRPSRPGILPKAGELRPETPPPKWPTMPRGIQPDDIDPPGDLPGIKPSPLVPPKPVAPLVPPPKVVEFPPSAPRQKKVAIPGYYARKIHGFNVLISQMAYDQSDEQEGKPLGYVETELARLAEIFPKPTVAALAKVPVWIEWDHTVPANVRTYGIYYGSVGEALAVRGIDPRKARSVCLLSLKTAYALRTEGRSERLVILHELAHAVHDQVLGLENPVVTNAYEQAMARRLYDSVRHIDQTMSKGYAATNEAEYFAELTCSYLDRLDYTPMNRAEMKEHDSVGYELMAKVWGTPEQIEARKNRGR